MAHPHDLSESVAEPVSAVDWIVRIAFVALIAASLWARFTDRQSWPFTGALFVLTVAELVRSGSFRDRSAKLAVLWVVVSVAMVGGVLVAMASWG